MNVLKDVIVIPVRFSEVDSMSIVWHGHYCQYLEEAREKFGLTHGLGYLHIYSLGFQIPLIELHLQYKQKLNYGDHVRVEIRYEYSAAAKIIFHYQLFRCEDNVLAAEAKTVQVFLDNDGNLQMVKPTFYLSWQLENSLSDD